MAVVNKVEQRAHLNKRDIIKFQLLVYCYFKGIVLSEQELACLALLGECGDVALDDFCRMAWEGRLYGSAQSVRNMVNKYAKRSLVVKHGKFPKHIYINPELNLQTDGNILLDLKFAYIS